MAATNDNDRETARELIGTTSERCGDCRCRLTWIEVAFGRVADPVCGRCLRERTATRR